MTKHEMAVMKLEIAIAAQQLKANIAYNKFNVERGKVFQLESRLQHLKKKNNVNLKGGNQ